jgi:predicted ester cyclase
MTRDAIVDLLTKRQDRWRQHDAIGLADCHAEQGVVVSPMFATMRGRPAIENSYRALFTTFPDWDFVPGDLLIDGDRAAQIFRATATHTNDFHGLPGTGRRFEISGVRVIKFENDLIAWEHRIYDFTSLLIQIGVLKAKPGY